MDLIRKVLISLILLLVVVVIWVGSSIFYSTEKDNLPNDLETYNKKIPNTFNIEELQKISDRAEESFITQPEDFLEIIGVN